MKKIFFAGLTAIVCLTACKKKELTSTTDNNTEQKTEQAMNGATIYDFKVNDITGEPFDLHSLKGKKVLIVNTASKCGLTPQFEGLEALYKKYKTQDFVIIGFPSNDFLSQDPGTNEEIATFCEKNYGVTFPMMEKIVVKGDGQHPLYQFLTKKSENGVYDGEIEWNFQKFLINKDGQLEKVFSPKTLPNDPEIIEWIEQ